MFTLLKSEVKPLTKELALEFRDLEPSPTEREINPARMRMLREKADAGQLITFNWAIARLGDKKLRMNGQHSSNMLCELDGGFPAGLMAHLDEYKVDNMEDLALLFRQFDDRKSGRSPGDVSGAYQGLYHSLDAVPRPIAKLGIEGVIWYRRYIEGVPVPSGDTIYSLFGETGLHSFLVWIGDLFSVKTPELRKPTIVSAMYVTFNNDELAAKKFWVEVARGGVEYEDNHPTTVLDGWLKAIKEDDEIEKPKPGELYQGCIFAWNAFRESKSIRDIKCDVHKGYHSVHK
jgi:hypothetical protein